MTRDCLFSSESVARGHPDKVADQIVDAILDDILSRDSNARVACEAILTTGLVLVSGEVSTSAYADIPAIVRRSIRAAGYDDPRFGFDYQSCAVLTSIDEQSVDIRRGVDQGPGKLGAGDQGIMFGYACDETPELMPLPIMLAHRMMIRLEAARVERVLPWLRPDGKGQVSVRYREGRPATVETVVLSAQHDDVPIETVREGLMAEVVSKVIGAEIAAPGMQVLINPTGRFVEGGPRADTGLSGRKIIVDTYGGMAPHGGGSFSGKDPTKVDRSGTYCARWVAKNVVAAGLARRCLVQIAYAIGVHEPVSVAVDTYGTGRLPDPEIERRIRRVFDLTPEGMIAALRLAAPIYRQTAYFGHFGRELPEFTWEKADRVKELEQAG
ncbi:MAG: methionine adenosyltransferase [Candidatus Eisenbacteria bacterium]|nr:methionine adenosyltransferase [Candidatus Eisenbacteria bacterium]